MAKITLSPKFLKETILLFKERSLKEIIFGKKVSLSEDEQRLLSWVKEHDDEFREHGGRSGYFVKIDFVHRGKGTVYLLSKDASDVAPQSVLLFSDDVEITPGPDLYVYLSTNKNPREGLAEFLDLGLLKGTKGGQMYIVDKPVADLKKYNSAVIYCKQFSVLFTFAELA